MSSDPSRRAAQTPANPILALQERGQGGELGGGRPASRRGAPPQGSTRMRDPRERAACSTWRRAAGSDHLDDA